MINSQTISDRFIRYIKIHTESDPETGLTPSTPQQMEFAQDLVKELKQIGLSKVSVDENGYVMATLPSNINYKCPVIGFIAHMDTSPDMSGRNVQPRIIRNYDGNDVILNKEENIILKTVDFPEILDYVGQDIIVTNGKTLLGADDKAGLTEIVCAMEYLVQHPEIKHGEIRIGFTPDEEIGEGTKYFNVEKFNVDWAYTMDGGQIGELEFENFNAAAAKIIFHGRNVHPGYAKHKMLNSIRIANQFVSLLSRFQTPEHTEKYEGFFPLTAMNVDVEQTVLSYIIRDHDRLRFEERKKELIHLTRKINNEFGVGTCDIEMKDQYYNMREKIEPVMHIVDLAEEAMKQCGIKPLIKPIRGGTDGANLSFKGIPCPNIFAGGHNFHGKFEFIPIPSMEKATEVILKIIELVKDKTV